MELLFFKKQETDSQCKFQIFVPLGHNLIPVFVFLFDFLACAGRGDVKVTQKQVAIYVGTD